MTEVPTNADNLLSSSGDFTNGKEDFSARVVGEQNTITWDKTAYIRVAQATDNGWDIQLRHEVNTVAGQRYTLCYAAWAKESRDISVNINGNGSETAGFSSIINQAVTQTITTMPKAYSHTVNATATLLARFTISFGSQAIDTRIDNIGIYAGDTCPSMEYIAEPGLDFSATTGVEPRALFEQINSEDWKQLLFDSGQDDWREHWVKDGLVGKIENSDLGMHIQAGPEAGNHAHHFVVWTKQVFSGDIKFEFEYTRTDTATKYVNVLYLFAAGEGTPGFDKDIMAWADYRNEPYMRHYFDNMNALHISYAAYGTSDSDEYNDYIRARRYMPLLNKGLEGTAYEGDNFDTGFFETDVPHHITVIKKGRQLFMKIKNDEKTEVYYWTTISHPDLVEGRIGIRHMFTRSAFYKNLKVSTLAK